MDERSLVQSVEGGTIERVSQPLFRTEVVDRTPAGVRIEITKTEERMVAYVDDPAKIDQIYAQLARLGAQGGYAIANGQASAPADRSHRMLLTLGAIVMLTLALTVAYLLGSIQHGPSPANQFFLPSALAAAPAAIAQSASAQPDNAQASEARDDKARIWDVNAARARANREQPMALPRDGGAGNLGDRRQTGAVPLYLDPARATVADRPSLPPPVFDSPAATAGNAPGSPLSKRGALDAAFASGAVQTWSEAGEDGFVIADPLKRDGNSTCRNMVLWKRGALQGDVQKTVRCAGSVPG